MSEREWLERAQRHLTAGEPIDGALRVQLDGMFSRIRGDLVRTCAGRTRDVQRAEDIVQEAMAIAWRRLPEYRFEGSYPGFVWGICKMLLLAAQRRISDVLTEDGLLEPASPLAGALAGLRDEEQAEVLSVALSELSPTEQEAIHLRYVEGVPIDAITARLGLTNASGARGLLFGARRRLEARLRAILAQRGHGSSFFFTSVP